MTLVILWHDSIFLIHCFYRKRDYDKCYDQVKITRKRDRETGLNTLEYELMNIRHMSVEDIPFVVLNIKLKCNKLLTPWCDCDGAPASERGKWPQVFDSIFRYCKHLFPLLFYK